MKTIGTTAPLPQHFLNTLKTMGYDCPQFTRIICGCTSRADANRQCAQIGLRKDTFQPSYTSLSGNPTELAITQNGGVFAQCKQDDEIKYISLTDISTHHPENIF